ncbi:hypothetical protein DPSP01_002626 [Paraphaeosphaeria sporulosa]
MAHYLVHFMLKWDADKDRQLLLGWLSFVNDKVEKGLTDHLAAIIGEGTTSKQLPTSRLFTDVSLLGCTAKAVHRRIEKIQAGVKPKEKSNPDTPYAAKTSKGVDIKIESEEDAKPKTTGRKRGRTERERERMNKKVKADNGEGEKVDDAEIRETLADGLKLECYLGI